MKVLLLGHTGLGKAAFAEDVRRRALREDRIVQVLDLEAETAKLIGKGSPEYIDVLLRRRGDVKVRDQAFDQCLKRAHEAEHVLLHLHAVYRRDYIPAHVLNWKQVEQFGPHMVVTLIDNVYQVAETIRNHPAARKDDASRRITLKDVMEWRAAEIMIGQNLADACHVKHYILAKRHGPELLYDLMFFSEEAHGGYEKGKAKKKVYLSFPIRDAWRDQDLATAVEDFRQKLKKDGRWIVFDPWTMDERLLTEAVHEKLRPFRGHPADSIGPSTLSVLDSEGAHHEVDLLQAALVTPDIDAQIPERDFQMINVCDMLVAFRPARSTGSVAEINHATPKNGGTTTVYALWPEHDPEPDVFLKPCIQRCWRTLEDLLRELPVDC